MFLFGKSQQDCDICYTSELLCPPLMNKWSVCLLFVEPNISSKTMMSPSYSLGCLTSPPISFVLFSDLEIRSVGELVFELKSPSLNGRRVFNIRQILSRKLDQNRSVRLFERSSCTANFSESFLHFLSYSLWQ